MNFILFPNLYRNPNFNSKITLLDKKFSIAQGIEALSLKSEIEEVRERKRAYGPKE